MKIENLVLLKNKVPNPMKHFLFFLFIHFILFFILMQEIWGTHESELVNKIW